MKKNQHIAFIVVSLEAGGTENYLLRFLRYLVSQEPELKITVICKGGKTGSLLEQFQELSVSIQVLKLGYINLKNIKKFKALLDDNYDVVCDLTGNFAGISMGLSKLNSVPKRLAFYRASSDHFSPAFFNKTYNKLMNRLVKMYATAILSNSTAAFNFFHASLYTKDKRFKIIKNGVNVELFSKSQDKTALRKKYGLPIDAVLVGHVGRLNAAKNFETMFQVIKEIKAELEEKIPIYFVFCGRETDSEIFKEKLATFGISERCFCLGEQTKVYEVLQCYDLFYFPSVTEGQPNALIEAMMSALPFVASNIDAIKESVPEMAYKQLVNPLDVSENITKIINTIQDPDPLLLQKWAIAEYEAEKRFEDFKKVLLD
jgi:glycosyltransferase involved in cell wall biosynthesis